jgi:hypothetical protein
MTQGLKKKVNISIKSLKKQIKVARRNRNKYNNNYKSVVTSRYVRQLDSLMSDKRVLH